MIQKENIIMKKHLNEIRNIQNLEVPIKDWKKDLLMMKIILMKNLIMMSL